MKITQHLKLQPNTNLNMPTRETRSISVEILVKRSDPKNVKHNRIEISSTFQRGDEETGVWNKKDKFKFLDSMLKSFPVGLITLVIVYIKNVMRTFVLDGGNRMRTLRDILEDELKPDDGVVFSNWDADKKARFKTLSMPVEVVTLEEHEPKHLICDMFSALNTSSKKLTQGELIKALGFLNNYPRIELAKKLSGWFDDDTLDKHITLIRKNWSDIFGGKCKRHKRSEHLKFWLAMINSSMEPAKDERMKRYRTEFEHEHTYHEREFSPEEYQRFVTHITTFLTVMAKVSDKSTFKIKLTIPSITDIALIWGFCIEDSNVTLTSETIIKFYQKCKTNEQLREKVKSIWREGDHKTSMKKIGKVQDFIKKTLAL